MWLVALGLPPVLQSREASFEAIRLLHDKAIFCRTSDRKGEPVVTVAHMTSRALECMYSIKYSNTTRSKPFLAHLSFRALQVGDRRVGGDNLGGQFLAPGSDRKAFPSPDFRD